jgi:hypothetical protein
MIVEENFDFDFFLIRLKYFGDEKYEIEGFTLVDKTKSQDTDYLLTSDSGKMKNYFF